MFALSLYQEDMISCKTLSIFLKGRDNSCKAWALRCYSAQSFSNETADLLSPKDWFDFLHNTIPLL